MAGAYHADRVQSDSLPALMGLVSLNTAATSLVCIDGPAGSRRSFFTTKGKAAPTSARLAQARTPTRRAFLGRRPVVTVLSTERQLEWHVM